MFLFRRSRAVSAIALVVLALLAGPAAAGDAPDAALLHAGYGRLLHTYVHNHLVDYKAWTANRADHEALNQYVTDLSALDPAAWAPDDALAYWLNLYNAVTLRLILDNYPLQSIKDLGGFLKKSPWKQELVVVAGRKLSLNDIENRIIRPTFGDPRVHFALNCASLGCPPLGNEAFVAERLSAQLDAACRLALNQERWVRLSGNTVQLTKIFDWYGGDFTADGGSVLDFVARYRTTPLPSTASGISFMEYDWRLNQLPEAESGRNG